MKTQQELPSLLRTAMSDCAPGLLGVGLFSAVTNILSLTGSLYMLQVYDRVLPSQSVPTLVGLTVGMLGLYAAYGLLDFVRLRLLVRIASRLYRNLHQRAFAVSVLLPLKAGREADRVDPLRDLDHLRGFLSGSGPTVIFDAPWIPFYLLIIYMLHPSLGVLATVGALAVVALTAVAEILGRRPARMTSEAMISQRALAESGRRNAEVVQAMGLSSRLARRWSDMVHGYLLYQERLSDIIGGTSSLSKALRMALQSSVLGLGAYLVIGGEASPGVIIASSILLGRALAPVDAAIANWKGFLTTRHSYFQLKATFDAFENPTEPMELPRPQTRLTVERLTVAPPGVPKPTVLDVNFQLSSGAGMAIVGPSGSGKTTLVRALVGAWRPLHGKVRLDGASLDQWNPHSLGAHIGYLPQDVELFDGTVADNISRFGGKSDPKGVLAAARAAGVYSMIMHLPEGFQTRIGEGGRALSAGQRQLIGLARALYGEPFLVVLDEPNSNLDVEGDAALAGAILAVRQRGGIVIVVAHRPSALTNIDQVLVLTNGMVRSFGSREEVLASVARASSPAAHRPSPVIPIQRGVSGHA
ncbi:type I secretion system permease/ATPase [Mesorhizobium sp.]|uniref:type I secretion system permease/ATPase n=3 Tax=unclassified Mesorhizobium TaxID=325217 RepID=UPI000FCBD452|nr:type I secretion system permease/ATPase [Mesorhizobium sp.]RUW31831.1 type I secretion system permease/ATPase [Mesorhizobium sp. M1E.F.Ca.ET.041.01.1.1]RWD91337.1 MAG: type I secretion system permease/ATPase [Mesorhizobium sp.]RWD94623.1 MAG: type I secretion system permease/ATPase [Mesorhizobium sp.]TIV55285.1 MAG: type I secretion system permease/ATPase [Mesorhizobium sp.]